MKITPVPTIKLELSITVSEAEAAALHVLSGYSSTDILKALEEKLSPYLVRDHGAGIASFLETARQELPHWLNKLAEARK